LHGDPRCSEYDVGDWVKLNLANVASPSSKKGRSDDRVTSIHHVDGGGSRRFDLRHAELGRR
jgi:hypothetical protein